MLNTKNMSTFYTEISLENVRDRGIAKGGYIPADEVRAITLKAMPDTGAWLLVINEETRQKLGLDIEGSMGASLADGSKRRYNLTEAVKICWQNRSTIQQAILVPDADDILLGALPLEAMDLMVDTVNETLVGVHGDEPLQKLKLSVPSHSALQQGV